MNKAWFHALAKQGASGFDLSGASDAAKNFSTASQETTVYGAVAISVDGTKFYVAGDAADTVYQYTLGTPFDASTGSYASKSMAAGAANPRGMAFSPDGATLFLACTGGTAVRQYTLGTPWDISTGSYASKTFSYGSQVAGNFGLWVNAAGTRMYILGSDDKVYQYTLGTPWDVSTASYASKLEDVSAQDTGPFGLAFSADETKMFISGNNSDAVFQYGGGTPGDVSTVSYAGINLDTSPLMGVGGTQTGICFSVDGDKLYIFDADYVLIRQYNL